MAPMDAVHHVMWSMDCNVIINFHGVGTPHRDLEPGEERYWISETFFIEIIDLIKFYSPDIRIDLTFDDGNMSDLEFCTPILKQNALKAVVFALAGRLEMRGSLSPQDLRTLQSEGMRIGTHGFDHVNWRQLGPEAFDREFITARELLEAAIDRTITCAAIPFGSYDRKVLKRLAQSGYKSVYSSDGGPPNYQNFVVARNSIRQDMTINDIENILLNRETTIRRFRRTLAMMKKRTI